MMTIKMKDFFSYLLQYFNIINLDQVNLLFFVVVVLFSIYIILKNKNKKKRSTQKCFKYFN